MLNPTFWFDLEDDVDDVDEEEEEAIKYWLGEDKEEYGEGEDDGYRDKKAKSDC